jgi:hypothetical protein
MTNQRGQLMTNFENLNERVENAVDKFHHSEELRRSENKSLSRILNELETKFKARTIELEDCQLRITELEDSNVSLSALVGQLVDLVEKSADEITQDPLYRASAAASDIVSRYVADAPADEEAAPAPALEQGPPPSATAEEALAAGRFEAIGEEFLLAEELFEKTEGAAEFPELVFDAIAVARGEEVSPPAAETTTAQVEEAGAAPLNDGDLDIKEIMARLEIAAERAQLRADEDARRDRSDLDPEVLDQADGGRA